ncbi:hypothetical protein AB0O95_03945 [Rhodoglobus sp. NPDC076762]
MTNPTSRTVTRGYVGMRRSTRSAIIAGIAVFLTLVSGVSFAAWNTSSATSATAATGAVALTSATTSGGSTITALGSHTYTATNQTVTKPLTVRNTGTVDASILSVAISRTGTLAGDQVAVKLWVGKNATCAASNPVVSSTLAGGTISLSALNVNLAAGGSAIICASTSFTGSMTTQAGKTTTATFAINSSAGTNWIATDSMTPASRSFTQDVAAAPKLAAPTNMQCTTRSVYWGAWYESQISWTAPTISSGSLSYEVYFDNGTGPTLLGTTSATSVTITRALISGDGDITVRATLNASTQSAASTPVAVQLANGWYSTGVACG